jgi:hypothetical protein
MDYINPTSDRLQNAALLHLCRVWTSKSQRRPSTDSLPPSQPARIPERPPIPAPAERASAVRPMFVVPEAPYPISAQASHPTPAPKGPRPKLTHEPTPPPARPSVVRPSAGLAASPARKGAPMTKQPRVTLQQSPSPSAVVSPMEAAVPSLPASVVPELPAVKEALPVYYPPTDALASQVFDLLYSSFMVAPSPFNSEDVVATPQSVVIV